MKLDSKGYVESYTNPDIKYDGRDYYISRKDTGYVAIIAADGSVMFTQDRAHATRINSLSTAVAILSTFRDYPCEVGIRPFDCTIPRGVEFPCY